MTARTFTSMWAQACAMLAETERLQRRFFDSDAASGGTSAVWEAPCDVFEHDSALTVWVALPGVSPHSIEIKIEGAMLRVSGHRHLCVEPRTAFIRRLEIPYGRFERCLELPRGSYDLDSVNVEHGCVRLQLRRVGGGT